MIALLVPISSAPSRQAGFDQTGNDHPASARELTVSMGFGSGLSSDSAASDPCT